MGEHYFFRVENDAALLVAMEQISSSETAVEIIVCAAGQRLMGISCGAHDSYVHSVEDFLLRSRFSVEVENKTSYFDCSSSLY